MDEWVGRVIEWMSGLVGGLMDEWVGWVVEWMSGLVE